jgi:predicted Zn-dependent peptidase
LDIRSIIGNSEPVQVAVLDNGFTLIHVERNSDLVEARLVVASGSLDDEIPGEMHFLEHLVAAHPRMGRLSQRYGTHNKRADTGVANCSYQAQTWRPQAGELIQALAQMVFDPMIDTDSVERERGIIQAEIKRGLNRARYIERFRQRMHPSHPAYHHPARGWPETVEQIDAKVLALVHEQQYTTRRSALITAGNLHLEEIAAWVAPFLVGIAEGTDRDRKRSIVRMFEQTGEQEFRDKYVGSPSNDIYFPGTPLGRDRVLETFCNRLFVELDYGLLMQELRHKRSWVYDFSFAYGTWPFVVGSLSFEGVSAPYQDVTALTLDLMQNVSEQTFDEERLAWAKNNFLVAETVEIESKLSIKYLEEAWLCGELELDYVECVKAVSELSPKEVFAIHQRRWRPDQLCVVYFRPA